MSKRLIDIGDKIISEHPAFGQREWIVHRVTKCYAHIRLNDVAEMRFRRDRWDSWNFYPAGERNIWDQTKYRVEFKEPSHD